MGKDNGNARRGLADTVFERMQRAIKSGAYRPEERLPTEHELAAEFEVSRPIIREALRRLREQGLIHSRQGAGSFVRRVGLRQPLGFGALENVGDLLNCYQFRLTIEPEAAAGAARHGDEAALARIGAAVARLRDGTGPTTLREDRDFQFHLAVALAADNSYFATVMEALKEHIALGMRFHRASVNRDPRALAQAVCEHDAIYAAIRARDPEAARKAMRDHLDQARDRLFAARRPDLVLEDELRAELRAELRDELRDEIGGA